MRIAGASRLVGAFPPSVSLYEVSLRDGLQSEPFVVTTAGKEELVGALADAGLRRIEITSFVSPRWIPQLADADALAKALPRRPGVSYSALCPNTRGLERAMRAGLGEIAVFLSASETHCRRNTNRTIGEALSAYAELVPSALLVGMQVRAYISTVWGCPYEGAVAPDRTLGIALRLLELGCYQISLGDTIGAATPLQIESVLDRLLREIPASKLALHLHDTRGAALANVLVGLSMGIRDYDASIGGLGGCPYAPGAAGNVATEDLAHMLDGMGIETGCELGALVAAARRAEGIVGRTLPGKVHKAGLFVPRSCAS